MAALKWSLMALAALLSSAICSAHRLSPLATGPIPYTGPTPAPIGSRPTPAMRPDNDELHRVPPTPNPSEDEEIASEPYAQPYPPADDSAVAVNCCGGGWGGCPPVPKNPYYCQPAGCSGAPGYGCGGAGFTIYMGDQFPRASANDDEQKS